MEIFHGRFCFFRNTSAPLYVELLENKCLQNLIIRKLHYICQRGF